MKLIHTFVSSTLTSAGRQAEREQSLAKGLIFISDFVSFPERGTSTTLRKCADISKPGGAVSCLKRGIPQRNLEGVQTSKEILVASTNKNKKTLHI